MLKRTRLSTTSLLLLACKESKAFNGFLGPFEGEKGAWKEVGTLKIGENASFLTGAINSYKLRSNPYPHFQVTGFGLGPAPQVINQSLG